MTCYAIYYKITYYSGFFIFESLPQILINQLVVCESDV